MPKRYEQAKNQTKPQMVRAMISRALRDDIHAQYFLADAWFTTKAILQLTEEKYLSAIVRMKKNKMKYQVRHTEQLMNAQELFKYQVKGHWHKLNGQPYQSKSVTVDLNLSTSPKEPEQWILVKLLFVRGVAED